MPSWVSAATCMKCKKKGHLAFNCPPKYSYKVRKSDQNKTSFNKSKQDNKPKEESAALVKEFAGMAYSCKHRGSYQNRFSKHSNPSFKNKTHPDTNYKNKKSRVPTYITIPNQQNNQKKSATHWDHRKSYNHHKIRVKIFTLKETNDDLKKQFYHLLFKNGDSCSGLRKTISQVLCKLNNRNLTSILWLMSNMKTNYHSKTLKNHGRNNNRYGKDGNNLFRKNQRKSSNITPP